MRFVSVVVGVVVVGIAVWVMVGWKGRSVDEEDSLTEDNYGPHPRIRTWESRLPTINAPAIVRDESFVPIVAEGFKVEKFARVEHGRNMVVLPGGDVLVAEARTLPKSGLMGMIVNYILAKAENLGESPNRITLLRDVDNDGVLEYQGIFLSGLNQPFGMALVGEHDFYVAVTDALLKCHYKGVGSNKIKRSSCKQVMALSASGYNNHWTRNIVHDEPNNRLLVTVGSASNIGEEGMDVEENRACVLYYNLTDGTHGMVTAGLRNPVGLSLNPTTGEWWTVVNERDMLGEIPDYLTRVVEGAHYGWPWTYFGTKDHRVTVPPQYKEEQLRMPDYALGAHTASLGLAFSDGVSFKAPWNRGAFVAQHGSWNRRTYSGYKVVFVEFDANGSPLPTAPRDFLSGFIRDTSSVFGRPVGLLVHNGSLLVSDDSGNVVWRVTPQE